MIVRLLADKMEFENGRPKPNYKHKLLAMSDEVPALGKLAILQESLAFVAGYGIKCYLISQDINQLKSRETGYGPDETIKHEHCPRKLFISPVRVESPNSRLRLSRRSRRLSESSPTSWLTGTRLSDSRSRDTAERSSLVGPPLASIRFTWVTQLFVRIFFLLCVY
jgi:type IV secretion system protein VirD4